MAPSKSAAQKSSGSRAPRGRTKGSQAPAPTSRPQTDGIPESFPQDLLRENQFVATQAYSTLERFAPPRTLSRTELETADKLGAAVRPCLAPAYQRLSEKAWLREMEPVAQQALVARVAAMLWWLEHA